MLPNDRHKLFQGQQLARSREILTGPRWEDLRFPAQVINPTGAAADPDIDSDDGSLLFDAGGTETIVGMAQLPHGWDAGTGIRPHIHWSPTNTNTGNVYWRLEYEVMNINGTYTASLTTDNKLDAGDGTTEKHQVCGFTEIAMTDFTESCIMKWKVSRIGGDGTDTYDADARLLEFDIHYKVNKLGSLREHNNIY